MYVDWPCPSRAGNIGEEMALAFDRKRDKRLLVLPALFDEANKMRRLTVEVMRRLNMSGIDCFLPDLPGCNESLAALESQTLEGWRAAATAAADHFAATHLLTIRAGALLAPDGLPGWRLAPTSGRQVLRAMLRSRTIAAKEAGRDETMEQLSEAGRTMGVELAGWPLGAALFAGLEQAAVPESPMLTTVEQSDLGGGVLWLRAEPDEDPDQADALAAIIAVALLGDGH
ncbi:MAG: hypothetical protein IE933_02525 [Sphingomonadales bacterium]|nr:hypothetical protein [Sphingomonadales bacterium]MBD3774597.1 hypothetical protein [Paracoccaceae bacterium]